MGIYFFLFDLKKIVTLSIKINIFIKFIQFFKLLMVHQKKLFYCLLLAFFITACIGTDYIDDPIVKERLTISPRIATLAVGQTQNFTARYSNQYGIEENKTITWLSTAPTRITITPNGRAEAIATGAAAIVARFGLVTDTLWLNQVGGNDTTFNRSGTFERVGTSYNVAGGLQILTIRGATKIVTDANFSVSAGPSLYLLLANHTNGRYTVVQGGNAVNNVSAQITANRMTQFSGQLTFDVPNNVNPADYQYAVLYCTLGPVFGFANLR